MLESSPRRRGLNESLLRTVSTLGFKMSPYTDVTANLSDALRSD
jgi:hypothetical protein